MIETQHPKLSVRRQCELVGVNRNRLAPGKLRLELIAHGWNIGRRRVRRLMRIMGIEALVPKPSLSIPNKSHKVYPYLLRHLEISVADEVWCADSRSYWFRFAKVSVDCEPVANPGDSRME